MGVATNPSEQSRQAFDSVLMSAFRLSRAAIPVLRRGGGGAIVNVASLTANNQSMASR